MVIECDEQARQAILTIGDLALRAGGNNALDVVGMVYSNLKLKENPALKDSLPSPE